MIGETLIDLYELLNNRGFSDLKPKVHSLKKAFVKVNEHFRFNEIKRTQELLHLTNLLISPISILLNKSNTKLRRSRDYLPKHKVREQDSKCILWLARQTGYNTKEKLLSKVKILAIKREHSSNLLENQVLTYLALHLSDKLKEFVIGEYYKSLTDEMKDHIYRFRNLINQWIVFSENNGIIVTSIKHKANNALRYDLNYKKVWLAHSRILGLKDRLEYIETNMARSLTESAYIMLISTFIELGYTLIEEGIYINDYAESNNSLLPEMRVILYRVNTKENKLNRTIITLQSGHILIESAISNENRFIFICSMNITSLDDVNYLEFTIDDTKEFVIQRSPIDGNHSFWKGLCNIRANCIEYFAFALSEPLPEASAKEDANEFKFVHIRADAFHLFGVNSTIFPFYSFTKELICNNPYYSELDSSNLNKYYTHGTSAIENLIYLGDIDLKPDIEPFSFYNIITYPSDNNYKSLKLYFDSIFLDSNNSNNIFYVAVPDFIINNPKYYQVFSSFFTGYNRNFKYIPCSVSAALEWEYRTDITENILDKYFIFVDLASERWELGLLKYAASLRHKYENEWVHFRTNVSTNKSEIITNGLFRSIADILIRKNIIKANNYYRIISQLKVSDIIEVMKCGGYSMKLWILEDEDKFKSIDIGMDCFEPAFADWINEQFELIDESISNILNQPRFDKLDCRPKIILSGELLNINSLKKRFYEHSLKHWGCELHIENCSLVSMGLKHFETKFRDKLPIWREYLPEFKLRTTSNWQILFDNNTSVEFGNIVSGRNIEFIANNVKSHLDIMIDSKEQDFSAEIVFDLNSKGISYYDNYKQIRIDLRAEYDTGGDGLYVNIESKDKLFDKTRIQWGITNQQITDKSPQLYNIDIKPFSGDDFNKKVQDLKETYYKLIKSANISLYRPELTTQLKVINYFLKVNNNYSIQYLWQEVHNSDIIDLCFMISYLFDTKLDYDSKFIREIKKLYSGDNIKTLKMLRRDILKTNSDFNKILLSTIGNLSSYAPLQIKKYLADRTKYLYEIFNMDYFAALRGLIFDPNNDNDKILIEFLLSLLISNKRKEHRQPECAYILRTIGTVLRRSENAIHFFAISDRAQIIFEINLFLLEEINLNYENVRNLLYALMSMRYFTNLDNGINLFGPGSENVIKLAHSLDRVENKLSLLVGTDITNRIKLKNIGLKLENNIDQENIIKSLVDIWQGKEKSYLTPIEEQND